jgi:hypothetical protein
MLVIAYAAAAFAKLDDGGAAWITHGAVRFVFIADAARAPFEWGRQIASSDTLSVLVSAAAIMAEGGMIVGAIWPNLWVRFAVGLVALGLHTGFYLLQGVFWPWWWTLMVAFVPWEVLARWLDRRPWFAPATPRAGMARLPIYTAAAVFVAVLQQPLVSLVRAEYSFVFSDFPMYANVYGIKSSKAEFAAFAERSYQPPPIVSFRDVPDDGLSVDERLREVDPEARLTIAIREIVRADVVPDSALPAIRSVAASYRNRFGPPPERVDAFVDTWRFDWSVAGFTPRQQARRVATIDLDGASIVAYRDQ